MDRTTENKTLYIYGDNNGYAAWNNSVYIYRKCNDVTRKKEKNYIHW